MRRTKEHLTPPQVAEKYGVAVAKVIDWIKTGELPALNLARRGCTRPRYSISPEGLRQFEFSRQVVPSDAGPPTRRLRRRVDRDIPDFF